MISVKLQRMMNNFTARDVKARGGRMKVRVVQAKMASKKTNDKYLDSLYEYKH